MTIRTYEDDDGVIHVYDDGREIGSRRRSSLVGFLIGSGRKRSRYNQRPSNDYLSDDEKAWIEQGCPDE